MEVIYCLYWKQPDKYYVGKTSSLKRRSKEHLDLLVEGTHYNTKLQDAYNNFGIPDISVLETCEAEEVFSRESHWITKLNSVNNGYNLIGGNHQDSTVIHDIPIPDPTIVCKFILIDSQNTLHYINNVNEFCKTNPEMSLVWQSAATEIGRVKRGVRKSYKGYRLYNGTSTVSLKEKYVYDIYSNGLFLATTDNIAEFCRNNTELKQDWHNAANCLRKVCSGTRKQYKGYTVIKKAR